MHSGKKKINYKLSYVNPSLDLKNKISQRYIHYCTLQDLQLYVCVHHATLLLPCCKIFFVLILDIFVSHVRFIDDDFSS